MQAITLIFHPMLIKKTVLSMLFCMALLHLKGQQFEFRPSLGVGNYSMSDFKDLLRQSVTNSPFNLKTTEDFPPYYFYELDFIYYPKHHFGIGLSTGLFSTAGRNHYADYSGSFREDINVLAANAGLLASYKSSIGKNYFCQLEVASGIKYSDLSTEDEFILGEFKQENLHNYWSWGWWIEPQFRIGRTFLNKYTCSFFAGYEYNLESKLKEDAIIDTDYWTNIDWSGIRAGISLSFILHRPVAQKE